MKSLILGDIHIGQKNGNIDIARYQISKLKNIILKAQNDGCKTIKQLGDIFDDRSNISVECLDVWKDFFIWLEDLEMTMHVLIGNHDCLYTSTLSVNSPNLLMTQYSNITIIDKPTEIDGMLLVPWICEDNKDICYDAIKNTTASLCLGHFEIAGSVMAGGKVCTNGLTPSLFNKFDLTISGHFHTYSFENNIMYIGTPTRMNFGESNDIKKVLYIDSIDGQYTHVPTGCDLYLKINYSGDGSVAMSKLHSVSVDGKCIQLTLSDCDSTKNYLKFVNNIEKLKPLVFNIRDLSYTEVVEVDGTFADVNVNSITLDNVLDDIIEENYSMVSNMSTVVKSILKQATDDTI